MSDLHTIIGWITVSGRLIRRIRSKASLEEGTDNFRQSSKPDVCYTDLASKIDEAGVRVRELARITTRV